MFKAIPIILAGTLLAGCATSGGYLCPQERKYTRAEQTQFLNDIGKSPSSIKNRLVPDYLNLRDQSRACRGE
jgi:hypothetical protein